MRSQWDAIANYHAKMFDRPQHPSPTPRHDPGSGMKCFVDMFYIMLFVRTHTKFGIKNLKIDVVIKI